MKDKLKELSRVMAMHVREGKIKIKPCLMGKEGQVLMMLNCPDCQYAHYRFVDDWIMKKSEYDKGVEAGIEFAIEQFMGCLHHETFSDIYQETKDYLIERFVEWKEDQEKNEKRMEKCL